MAELHGPIKGDSDRDEERIRSGRRRVLLIGLLAGAAAAIQVSAIVSLVLTGWLPARLPDFRGLAELNPNPALLIGIGVIAVLVFLVLGFFVAPRRYVRSLPDLGPPPDGDRISLKDQVTIHADQEKRRNDLRTGALQAIGGLALIFALLTTLLQLQANQKQATDQQDLTRRGQIADRFTKAIDQLGNQNNLDVRLGGIYALEQIARDSRDDRTRLATYEVLTAYVRQHAIWSLPASGAVDESLGELQARAPDIQAVMTVLGRREVSKNDSALDLHGVDLRKAQLRGARVEGAFLESAHLERADLDSAQLQGADLQFANLQDASLVGAHLERAFLGGAHVEKAWLNRAYLGQAYLGGAHLEGAILIEAHLEKAVLFATHLERADLDGAHLEKASLTLAQLEDATIQNSHLEGAALGGAQLERTHLYGAHLESAQLSHAHLEDAQLYHAHLEGANLQETALVGALADRYTVWPAGFDWRAAGVKMANW